MKRAYTTLFVIFAVCLLAQAQQTPLEKYAIVPGDYDELFLDHVTSFASKVVEQNDTRCIGQMDKDGKMYGYGTFINANGSQIIGKFRNGEPMLTITMGQQSAMVGSPSFHCSYSLSTGQLESVVHGYDRMAIADSIAKDYTFMRQRYANGDEYIGELYQGERHGYGIYYYADGSSWFGQFNHNVRSGYGFYLTAKKDMIIGRWEGEDLRREIKVKKL